MGGPEDFNVFGVGPREVVHFFLLSLRFCFCYNVCTECVPFLCILQRPFRPATAVLGSFSKFWVYHLNFCLLLLTYIHQLFGDEFGFSLVNSVIADELEITFELKPPAKINLLFSIGIRE